VSPVPDEADGKEKPIPKDWFPKDHPLPEATRLEFQRFANLGANIAFPEFSTALKGLFDSRFTELSRVISANLLPQVTSQELMPGFQVISRQLAESFSRVPIIDPNVLASIAEGLTRYEPANFKDLDFEQQIQLVELSLEHSFGSLEALPSGAIADLLACDGDTSTVEEVLADHAQNIAEHCIDVLSNVPRADDPDDCASLAADAATALVAGNFAGTQALATVVWDSLLSARWNGRGFTSKIKASTSTSISHVDQAETLYEFYWKAWLGPAVVAYSRPQLGSAYSRNGTVHHASPSRFGKPHAVQALTIATTLLGYLEVM